jgi:cell division transport system ATP-binding protein
VIGKSKGFIQEAVPDVLEMVGLDGKAKRLPHELSGGEQQRVAIARAVVNKPQILLADEPTGNLDPATSAGIVAVLDRINAGGTTVVMATHEAAIVDQMQRRVIELVNGQVVRDERHGGYGFTAAIPTQTAERREQPREREREPELVGATASRVGASRADTGVLAETVAMTRPVTLTRPVPLQTSAQHAAPDARQQAPARQPEQRAPQAPAPARPQPTQPEAHRPEQQDTGVVDGHFAAAPSRPRLPADDLPEQLGLAEQLGLRRGDQDLGADQNVGPVK